MWPSHDRTILISYIMASSPWFNPLQNTEDKLLNWVCVARTFPALGRQSFLVLRPDGVLHRIADPCQAQLMKPQTRFDIRGPKHWILLGNSQAGLNLHIVEAFCDTQFAYLPKYTSEIDNTP
jgi:hypothetical protein